MNIVKKGSTDISRYVMLVDSAAGTPETGYTITDLDLQYTRNRSAPAAKVDATALAATDSSHADNKAIQVDATSSPGLYRIDWPDAAFATGADKVILVVSGTGLHPAVEEIQLVNYDPEDAVRLGLTALPNAAADAAGGLPISDAGGLDLDAKIGALTFTVANKVDANATHISGDSGAADNAEAFFDGTGYAGTNNVIPTVTTVTNQVAANVTGISGDSTAADNLESAYDGTGYAHTGNTYPWTAAWDAEVQSEVEDALVVHRLDELLNADSDIDGAAPPTVGSVFHELMTKTAGSFTFDQTTDSLEAVRDRGDAAWITATGFSTHTAADVWAVGTRTLTAATNITSTGGSVPITAGGLVSSDVTAVSADTTAADNLELAFDGTGYAFTGCTINLASAYDFAKGTVAVTESYNADGSAPTPVQALMLIMQALTEISFSGTTGTVKKLDGSTTAATLTINDASTPTSVTRSG